MVLLLELLRAGLSTCEGGAATRPMFAASEAAMSSESSSSCSALPMDSALRPSLRAPLSRSGFSPGRARGATEVDGGAGLSAERLRVWGFAFLSMKSAGPLGFDERSLISGE